MIKIKSITIGKFEKNAINEDSVAVRRNMVAVSDGAGGGGLFADRWSKYLVKNLPQEPIVSVEQLDAWIGDIWESYYNKAEALAKQLGGMALDKFYDEGSFATLAVVWQQENDVCQWMTYGDSVVFHYDYVTQKLWHSFGSLADFDKPPFLINCKDELPSEGFKGGNFPFKKTSMVFVTSDALAHYILMMYELSQRGAYREEIARADNAGSKNSNFIKRAASLPSFKFETMVIEKLRKAVYDRNFCKKWLSSLYQKGLLALDDYSLVVMYE